MTHPARTLPPIVEPGKQPYCGPLPVNLGTVVPHLGLDWVVTGWNVRRNAVYLARCNQVVIVTPAALGMVWK